MNELSPQSRGKARNVYLSCDIDGAILRIRVVTADRDEFSATFSANVSVVNPTHWRV